MKLHPPLVLVFVGAPGANPPRSSPGRAQSQPWCPWSQGFVLALKYSSELAKPRVRRREELWGCPGRPHPCYGSEIPAWAHFGALCDSLPGFVGPFFPMAINTVSWFVVCVCPAEQFGVIGFLTEIYCKVCIHSTLLPREVRKKKGLTSVPVFPLLSPCFGQILDSADSHKCPSSCIPHLECWVPAAGAFCSPVRCLAAADLLFCIFI